MKNARSALFVSPRAPAPARALARYWPRRSQLWMSLTSIETTCSSRASASSMRSLGASWRCSTMSSQAVNRSACASSPSSDGSRAWADSAAPASAADERPSSRPSSPQPPTTCSASRGCRRPPPERRARREAASKRSPARPRAAGRPFPGAGRGKGKERGTGAGRFSAPCERRRGESPQVTAFRRSRDGRLRRSRRDNATPCSAVSALVLALATIPGCYLSHGIPDGPARRDAGRSDAGGRDASQPAATAPDTAR